MTRPRRVDPPTRRAFEATYQRYYHFVRRALSGLVRDELELDDLAQEVFLVLLRKSDVYDPSNSPTGWLYQVARRVASHHRRKQSRQRRKESTSWHPSKMPSPESEVARLEAAAVLVQFLEGLSDDDRTLFLGAEIDAIAVPQLARDLGLNVNTAYARLRRLRRDFAADTKRHRDAAIVPWLVPMALRGERTSRITTVIVIGLLLMGLAWWLGPSRDPGGGHGHGGTDALAPVRGSGPDRRPGEETSGSPDLTFTGSYVGEVVDEHGRPVAAAAVCADRWMAADHLLTASPTCTTTNEDGRFRLDGVLRQAHTLDAMAAGFLPGRAHGRPMAGVRIVLRQGGVPIRGIVVDTFGGPIADAWIAREIEIGPSLGAAARTDAEGRFELWVERGSLTLAVGAEGYATTFVPVAAPAEFLTIDIGAASSIAGKIIMRDTGSAVADATVIVGFMHQPGSYRNHGVAVRSDAAGRFDATGLQPGRYIVDVSATGGYGRAPVEIDLGIGERREDVLVELAPGVSVTGIVTDAESGEPCPDGFVAADPPELRIVRETRVEADGRATLRGLPMDAAIDIVASCAGYAPAKFTVHAKGDTIEHHWPVEKGQSVRGRVLTRAGDGVSGWTVTLYPVDWPDVRNHISPSTTSDADGWFELVGKTPGEYRIQAHGSGHPPIPPRALHVAADARHDVLLYVEDGFSVSGRVERRGQSLAGMLVLLFDPSQPPEPRAWQAGANHLRIRTIGGHGPFVATTLADGTFTLDGVPMGTYGAWVNDDPTAIPMLDFTDSNLPEGDPLRRVSVVRDITGLVLRVSPADGTITGTVHDDEGPVRDAAVFVEPMTRPERTVVALGTATLTDADGRFERSGLSNRLFRVTTHRRGGGFATAEDVRPGEFAELRLPKTGSLAGTVHDASGKPVDGFIVILRGGTTARPFPVAGTHGKWQMDGVQPGTYALEASNETATARTMVQLAPGEHKRGIDLRVDDRATVKGRVVDATGRIRRGVWVMAVLGGFDTVAASSSDDAGAFTLDFLPAQPLTIHVQKEGSTDEVSHVASAHVDPRPGQTVNVGDVTVR